MKKLSKETEERLNLLQEECAEVIQAASKIKRFGFDNTHPRNKEGPTNKEHLEEEVGGLCAILTLLAINDEINEESCSNAEVMKLRTIEEYTEYQKEIS